MSAVSDYLNMSAVYDHLLYYVCNLCRHTTGEGQRLQTYTIEGQRMQSYYRRRSET
ncbi:unnamed protein product, partial [Staurois parvus]